MANIELYNKDCLEIIKKMPDHCIDLIMTDPPYDVSATNKGGTINNIKKLNKSLNDLVESNIYRGYNLAEMGEHFMRIMKNPNIYIWTNKKYIPQYFDFYVTKNKCKFDIIVWHKTNALPTYSNKYLTDCEYCLYFHKNAKCQPQNYESATTVYELPINHKDKKIYGHPTIKPLSITSNLIANSTKEGDIVFDPYMGSGTTGEASVNLKRQFIGCEINNNYYNISKNRIFGINQQLKMNIGE